MRKMLFCAAAACLLAGSWLQAAPPKDDKKAEANKPIVAVFKLDGDVTETPSEDSFPFGSLHQISFKDLIARLKKAAADPQVKGLVLISDSNSFGAAQTEEVRQALAQVKAAGKEIYAHADSLSMGQFVLLSGATRLSVVPTADLWISGLAGEAPYIRGLLDLLGVQPEFLTCGEYKSAAEMFMRKGPSPEAERMQNWLLDSLFESEVQQIAKGRGVDVAKVKSWIDGGPYTASKGKSLGMIDAVESRETFNEVIKEKLGKDITFTRKYGEKKAPQLDLSSPFAFLKVWGDLMGETQKKKSTKSAIGIVYVEGAISLGSSQASPFGGSTGAMSTDIRKALDEAAADDTIKAVVLRVNSPGGSAVASDIILEATKRVKAKKPFIVSMGDVAGSGGYYVACGSDLIYADETTITGSIGVVGGKIVTTGMWNKVGVSFKEYTRGANAGMLSSSRPWSKDERQKMQAWMDEIYGVFKGHVMAIRGSRLKKPIEELAGGRVYTGKQALELGLIDKIGSLQDAIAYVADQAKLKDYDIRAVPEPKNFIEQILDESAGGKDDPKNVRLSRLGTGGSLLDLALPHLRGMDPERLRAMERALKQLQMLQQEGVLLAMPELRIVR